MHSIPRVRLKSPRKIIYVTLVSSGWDASATVEQWIAASQHREKASPLDSPVTQSIRVACLYSRAEPCAKHLTPWYQQEHQRYPLRRPLVEQFALDAPEPEAYGSLTLVDWYNTPAYNLETSRRLHDFARSLRTRLTVHCLVWPRYLVSEIHCYFLRLGRRRNGPVSQSILLAMAPGLSDVWYNKTKGHA